MNAKPHGPTTEQRAILKLAEEKAANAVAFLRKGFPQLAREQLRAALADLDLAELLGGPIRPVAPPQIHDVEVEVVSNPTKKS